MSGGHFDYQQYRIEDIAVSIDELIAANEVSYHYPRDIISKFEEARKTLRLAAAMAQRIDWLVSDDDGEGSFRSRWQEEVDPLRKAYERGYFK